MKTYLFEYPYNGSFYSLEIPADSEEEAKARFQHIQYGKFAGTRLIKIPKTNWGEVLDNITWFVVWLTLLGLVVLWILLAWKSRYLI